MVVDTYSGTQDEPYDYRLPIRKLSGYPSPGAAAFLYGQKPVLIAIWGVGRATAKSLYERITKARPGVGVQQHMLPTKTAASESVYSPKREGVVEWWSGHGCQPDIVPLM